MKNKSKKEKCSVELEALMSKFVPAFGDSRDKWIVTQYGRIKDWLSEIDSDRYRELMRKKDHKSLSPKMKDIRNMEFQLVTMLTNRENGEE